MNEEAVTLNEEALKKMRRILGNEHSDTLMTSNNLALMYQSRGRTKEAVGLNEEVLEKRKRILGNNHLDTLTSMSNLALMFRRPTSIQATQQSATVPTQAW